MAEPACVRSFFDPATHAITHLLWDADTRAAAIIDPVLDYDASASRLSTPSADRVLATAQELGLSVSWILETHAHADHLSAAHYLRRLTGAPVGIGEHILSVQAHFRPIFGLSESDANASSFDQLFADGDTLSLGRLDIQVIHTPGHTADGVTYLAGDAAFIGDTFFMPDYGTARADFPGADASALYRSCQKLLSLPVSTRLYLCHDYTGPGRKQPACVVTVAEQRAFNVQMNDRVPEEAYVAMRQRRDITLGAPALLLPALQVNICGGRLPPASSDGRRALTLPLAANNIPGPLIHDRD